MLLLMVRVNAASRPGFAEAGSFSNQTSHIFTGQNVAVSVHCSLYVTNPCNNRHHLLKLVDVAAAAAASIRSIQLLLAVVYS